MEIEVKINLYMIYIFIFQWILFFYRIKTFENWKNYYFNVHRTLSFDERDEQLHILAVSLDLTKNLILNFVYLNFILSISLRLTHYINFNTFVFFLILSSFFTWFQLCLYGYILLVQNFWYKVHMNDFQDYYQN